MLKIVEHFKSKEHVVESGNTASSIEDKPELIPCEVLDVVESLRVALKIKFAVDVEQRKTRKIASVFTQCALNPHDMKKVEFDSHFQSLSDDSIYDSLIQNQHTVEF